MATRFIDEPNAVADIAHFPGASGVGVHNGVPFINTGAGPQELVRLGSSGITYYVDANLGADTNSGKSFADAFLTMAQAFSVIASGDTIRFRGTIREQLTTPQFIFDVAIIGEGYVPRHADSHPPGSNKAANTWKAPASPTATTALIKIIQQGWRLENILFAGPTDAESVMLYRDAGADPVEKDASHATIIGCRFASGMDGIGSSGQPFNVRVYRNVFQDLTGFAIRKSTIVADAGVANPLQWEIVSNRFIRCINGVQMTASYFLVTDNYFDDGGTPNTTVVLDLVGVGGGGNNIVVNNFFQTSTANFNTPDIVGNSTDVWNNTSIDGQASSIGREVGQPA